MRSKKEIERKKLNDTSIKSNQLDKNSMLDQSNEYLLN
jgi:hypothetical protein